MLGQNQKSCRQGCKGTEFHELSSSSSAHFLELELNSIVGIPGTELNSSSDLGRKVPVPSFYFNCRGKITPKLTGNCGHESLFWGQKWTRCFLGIFQWQTMASHIWQRCPSVGTVTELELSSFILWGEPELNLSSSHRRNWGTELSSF